MDAEPLDAEVKARVPTAQKTQLERIAVSRHLKVADIVREALREKIELASNQSESQEAEVAA